MTLVAALAIRVETEMATDAIADLARAYGALAHRHGESFRRLERDIETFCTDKGQPASEAHELPGDVVVLAPSAPLRALVARAKALGVI